MLINVEAFVDISRENFQELQRRLDDLFEQAGASLAAHMWSDRIYWPLAGNAFYESAKAEADADQRARVLEYIRAR